MSSSTLNRFIEELHSIIANKEMFMTELREYFKKHPLEEYRMNNLDEILGLGINSNRLFKDSITNNNPVEFAYKRIHQIMGINISRRKLSPVHTPSPVNRGPPQPYQPPAKFEEEINDALRQFCREKGVPNSIINSIVRNVDYTKGLNRLKEDISNLYDLSGGEKEYVKLQSGGKRLVRYGKRGGRYYMKDGKKKYIK